MLSKSYGYKTEHNVWLRVSCIRRTLRTDNCNLIQVFSFYKVSQVTFKRQILRCQFALRFPLYNLPWAKNSDVQV